MPTNRSSPFYQSPSPSLDLHNFQSPSCTLTSIKPNNFLYPSRTRNKEERDGVVIQRVETSTSSANHLDQHFSNTSLYRTATSQSSQHASGEVKAQSVALFTQLVRAKPSSCYEVLVGESTGGGTTSKMGPRLEVKELNVHTKLTDLWTLQQLSSFQDDIGASTVLVTHDRFGVGDYTLAVNDFKPQLYYKVQSVRAARNIYVLPFSSDVWVSLWSLLLAITVALTFILGSETRLPQLVDEQPTPRLTAKRETEKRGKGKKRKGGTKRQKYQGTPQEQQHSRLVTSIPNRPRQFQLLGDAASRRV
uniref:(California timema) hypothetical protein n=1 Tax=Timema californicum TaxID=61474 RepID=A0A7R9PD99_TIMCA|nr:unnamed protein product [Timema californicum]